MKIVHIELAGFYNEGMTYQTNCLVNQHAKDGHAVTIISSNFCWQGAEIVKLSPSDQMIERNVRLIRLSYTNPDSRYTHQKLRRVPGLYQKLEELAPDVILCHCLQFWSVLDVIRYKKHHPEVKFYADTHTATNNSGTNWLSLHVLHRVFYKRLIQKAIPYLEKYFYIGEDERKFSAEHYDVPDAVMEFYPLGGTLPTEEDRSRFRSAYRTELCVGEDEMLLIHAGKLEPKKKTAMLLRAFAAVPELKAKLAVIGSIPKEQKAALLAQMAEDSRVIYLGWKSGEELQEYLCAADLYVQPGKVSAIMQNAVCCGCPVMTYPHTPYTKDYDFGNLIWISTEEELIAALRKLAQGGYDLPAMRRGSEKCARELLDYRALAARLYR